jgi:hypothetical protein
MMIKDNRQESRGTRVQKKILPSDKQIRKGFEQLFLSQLGTPAYTSASEFARGFKRCTLFEETDITTTAHVGV